MSIRSAVAAALAAVALSCIAAPPVHWSPSWSASAEPLWSDDDFVLPTNVPAGFAQQTLRQAVRLSVGGESLRVTLSNEEGSAPLQVGAASVARALDGSSVDAATLHVLRFGGRTTAVIPPGARLVSDPVRLALPALSRVAVSIYLPEQSAPAGFHWDAHGTVYVAQGDATAAAALPARARRLTARAFLAGIQVQSPRPTATVVALGDSLTDGNGSTPDADRRWPDALAERLASRGVGVVNAGISGGRLLRDGMGRSALARMERDVFAVPGVRAVIVLLGTNDIGWPGGPFAPRERPATADELIQGFRQLTAAAHAHDVRIVVGTITPFEHALAGTPLEGHYSPAKDAVRNAVNDWIRGSGEFDAVVDFDALLRDPSRPSQLLPKFDSGDHLHPGDEGHRAMAEAIDLASLGP